MVGIGSELHSAWAWRRGYICLPLPLTGPSCQVSQFVYFSPRNVPHHPSHTSGVSLCINNPCPKPCPFEQRNSIVSALQRAAYFWRRQPLNSFASTPSNFCTIIAASFRQGFNPPIRSSFHLGLSPFQSLTLFRNLRLQLSRCLRAALACLLQPGQLRFGTG